VSLLLYAITTAPDAPAPRGVLSFEVDAVTVWAKCLAEDRPPFTKDDVLEHHRVVSEIFALVRSCLPFRFPTEVEDVAAIDVETFAPQLERVRDACELAVTAAWHPPLQESTPPVTADMPGRRYLQQRQLSVHRRAQAEQLADHILEQVKASVLEESRSVCPSQKIALSLALLVPQADAQAVMSRIPRSAQDVRILINGPWPPYTFAAARLEHTHGRGTGGAQA
jgi:gas vesicle protein GvpL/GvpF